MGMEGFFNKAKRGITTTVAATTLAMGAAHAEGGDGDKGKKDPVDGKNKTEVSQVKPVEKNNTVNFYTSSKTEAGATTPTGLSNSFLENDYGITAQDMMNIAKHYGFSTESAAKMQADMFEYVQKNNPTAIDSVLEKFGQTAAGKLDDGLFGRRSAYLASMLKENLPPVAIPEVKQEAPQPNTSYMVDVRGDEPNGTGGFFFVKTLDDMKKINAAINFSRAEEFDGGARAQTGVNMTLSTFMDQVPPGVKILLGPAWHRDPNDPTKFVLVGNTVSYMDYVNK